jgi:hypothetical protein
MSRSLHLHCRRPNLLGSTALRRITETANPKRWQKMRSNRQSNNGSPLFALPLLHPQADELKRSLLISGRMPLPGYSSAPHLTGSGRGTADRARADLSRYQQLALQRNRSKPSGALCTFEMHRAVPSVP